MIVGVNDIVDKLHKDDINFILTRANLITSNIELLDKQRSNGIEPFVRLSTDGTYINVIATNTASVNADKLGYHVGLFKMLKHKAFSH